MCDPTRPTPTPPFLLLFALVPICAVDPYVKVELAGVPKDKFSKKTRVVKNNGFSPRWTRTFDISLACTSLDVCVCVCVCV